MGVVEMKKVDSPGYVWERKSVALASETGVTSETRKRSLETLLRLWLVQT